MSRPTIHLLTLFPAYFESPFRQSLLGKAFEKKLVGFQTWDLREYGVGKYRKTDDIPYGGGSGMVMKIEPIDKALREIRSTEKTRVVMLGPRGRSFSQKIAREYARVLENKESIAFICGHYEGVDERVAEHLCDDYLSIGDFVLSGGEPAALMITDAIVRLLPGFMGNPDSLKEESFDKEGFVEYPQYTRPEEYKEMRVPPVLLSGNHAEINAWRKKQSGRARLSRAQTADKESERPDSYTPDTPDNPA